MLPEKARSKPKNDENHRHSRHQAVEHSHIDHLTTPFYIKII